MLSIGKMDADPSTGRYYLQAVARGREDYYTHSGEAPGRWFGGGCGTVGVEGRVQDAPFLALLNSADPKTGENLGRRRGRDKVAGLDLTFSAPKSVSLLYSLGGAYGHQNVSDAVRAAHDGAVEDALGYLQAVAGHGRRGTNGVERIATEGLIHGLFRHRTSRAGDPQLHTHAVTINRVRGVDGKWGALDGKAFYTQAKTAGTLYRTALRYRMRDLGLEWEPGRDRNGNPNGLEEIRGFSRKLLREFSQRRQEIERDLATRGLDQGGNAKAAQKATLSTRAKKDYDVDPDILEFGWASRAAREGFTVDVLDGLLRDGQERLRALPDTVGRETVQAQDAAKRLLSADGLTEHASTFTERDVVRQIAAGLPDGALVEHVLGYAQQLLADVEVVRLPGGERGHLAGSDVIRVWSGANRGQIVPAMGGAEARFTTRELQVKERQLVDWAVAGQHAGAPSCSPAAVNAAVDNLKARGVTLTAEQDLMVRAVCLSGDLITVVNAAAGCGKTTAMGAAARALEASGFRVIGTSLAAKAAGLLQDETAVPCFTVAQLLHELRSSRWEGFARGTVVIVDEASMVGTRALHMLASELRQAGGKLIPVGDVHQLPEVDAGGAFRGLIADGRLEPVRLVQNMRQLDPVEQARLRQLRNGDVGDALRSYDVAGKVCRAETAEDARNLLAVAWSRTWLDRREVPAAELAGFAMIGMTNADVADLNRRARLLLQDAGMLSGPELQVAEDGRPFQVGDHVVTREISRRSAFHVLNGERWVVTGLDVEAGTVDLDSVASRRGSRTVTVPRWYLEDGSLHHGYALTVNISQGTTLTAAFCLGSEAAYRQAVYTEASRPTDDLRFFLTRDPVWVDDVCEQPHVADRVDRRQLSLDLGDLGVLVPAEVDPLDVFIRLAEKVRGDALSIDSGSPDEPLWRDPVSVNVCRNAGFDVELDV